MYLVDRNKMNYLRKHVPLHEFRHRTVPLIHTCFVGSKQIVPQSSDWLPRAHYAVIQADLCRIVIASHPWATKSHVSIPVGEALAKSFRCSHKRCRRSNIGLHSCSIDNTEHHSNKSSTMDCSKLIQAIPKMRDLVC